MNIKDTANEIIQTAKKYLGTEGDINSASLAYTDAQSLFQEEDYKTAIQRALVSLSHSVGVFHIAYKQAYWQSDNISV
jgi:uncharacterized protein (UPF0332 family)